MLAGGGDGCGFRVRVYGMQEDWSVVDGSQDRLHFQVYDM